MYKNILTLFAVYLIVTGTAAAFPDERKNGNNCPTDLGKNSSVIQSGLGTCVKATFNSNTYELVITDRTTSHQSVDIAGVILNIDERRVADYSYNLSADERWKKTINVSSHLDVVRDNHTVTVSTYGNVTKFNFTKRIDASQTNIPKPHITDVRIGEGTIDGEPSSVAYVTVVNPSNQLYTSKLMVHTQETDGSFYVPAVQTNESRTVKVELLDDRGEKIAGEARLYTKNLSREDGALDQVEFVGRASGNTSVWNESFEPIRGPWREKNTYSYENETYSRSVGEKVSDYEVEGIPIVILVAGLLGALLLVRKLR